MTQTSRRSGSGQLPWWFGVPFVIGGLFAAAVGVVLLMDELRFGREGVSVAGTVIETTYSAGAGENGPSWSIRYEYVDPATGTSHRGESDVDESTYESTTAGAEIEVTYLPAEPTKSRVGSPEPQLFVPVLVFGMAAIFVAVGVFMLILVRRIRSHGAPAWLTVTSGSGTAAAATWAHDDPDDDEAQDNPLAAFLSDDAAPPPTETRAPLTDAELRALDARLAPKEDKP